MGISQSLLKSESLESLMSSRNSYLTNTVASGASLSTIFEELHLPVDFRKGDLSRSPRLLTVPATLMNCELRAVCHGHLELRTREISFRDETEHSLSWPLETIRWFGENVNYFLFECGRKSPSGPSLFVFKCRRAKHISKESKKQIHRLLALRSNRNPVSTSVIQPTLEGLYDRRVQLHFGVSHPAHIWSPCKQGGVSGEETTGTCETSSCTNLSTLPTDCSMKSNSSEELEHSSSYPILLVQTQRGRSQPTVSLSSADTQPQNYGSLATTATLGLSSDSQAGTYVIPAPLHQYVNQPNGLVISHVRIPDGRFQEINEYVEEPQ